MDEMKLRDNTFVMFTSDNGPETLNRYRGSHRSFGSPGLCSAGRNCISMRAASAYPALSAGPER